MQHLVLGTFLMLIPAGRVYPVRTNQDESPDTERSGGLLAALPRGGLITVDGGGIAEILGNGPEDPLIANLLETDIGGLWRASDRSPAFLLSRAEEWLEHSPTETLRALTAGGLALAWFGEERGIVLVGRGIDGTATAGAVEAVLAALGRQLGVPSSALRPVEVSEDVDRWTLGEARLVRSGKTWIITQDERLLAETLERLPETGTAAPDPRRSRRVVVRFDLDALSAAGNPGALNLRRAAGSPGFRFALGDTLTGLAHSGELIARLELREEGLRLDLEGSGGPDEEHASAQPAGAALERDDDLAFAVLHRDVARWIRQRAELFPPESLPAFAEALGNLTLFAGGRDVEQDVLPALSPWWTVIARQPHFEEGAVPAIELPGLALVVPVRSAEDADTWVAAFQTVVTVTNVEAAQQGRRGFLLELEPRGDVTITRARPARRATAELRDLRDNLAPAVAATGGVVVLGTHVSLVREILDRLNGSEQTGTPRERGRIDLLAAARQIERHRAVLEMQKRLEEGLSPQQAAREIEGLRAVLASFSRLDWTVLPQAPGRIAVELTLSSRPTQR
jgi:hypothetical protein